MKIQQIGRYTLITQIPSLGPKGEIKQFYKKGSNKMIQILKTDTYEKHTLINISTMKTLQETFTEVGSNLVKVLKSL